MSRRPWAWPLVPLYMAASALKQALIRPKKLQWPVISIGSLSAGGAGKTPIVITLANLLQERGWHVDILSRGYRSQGRGSRLVVLDSPNAARSFGDEPLVLAERTGAPVWVGPNRYASGSEAEKSNPSNSSSQQQNTGVLHSVQDDGEKQLDENESPGAPFMTTASSSAWVGNETVRTARSPSNNNVHLLDDGFQHGALARTVDIVLVTLEDLDDAPLPAGNLRVGMRALLRAHAVVIREEEREAIEPRLKPLLAPSTLLWSVRRTLRFPAPLGVLGAGLRPVAFCAISRPENFAAMLVEAGCGIAETIAFRDHSYPHIAHILEVARGLNATGLITTEKDAVKLTPADRAQLETLGPLVVVSLDANFLYPERVLRELEARLA